MDRTLIKHIIIVPEEGLLSEDEETLKNIAEELVVEMRVPIHVQVEGDIEPSYTVDPPEDEHKEFPKPTTLGQEVTQ